MASSLEPTTAANSSNPEVRNARSALEMEKEVFISAILRDERLNPIPENPKYVYFKEEIFSPILPSQHLNVSCIHISSSSVEHWKWNSLLSPWWKSR
jgi:hypothetical protein